MFGYLESDLLIKLYEFRPPISVVNFQCKLKPAVVFDSCVYSFKDQYDQCPCQVRRSENFNHFRWLKLASMIKNIILNFQDDCPLGCPCDAFDCQPDKKSVLVLNTYTSSNVPVHLKFDGEFD